MDVIFTHGAGLDGHKMRPTACRVTPDQRGQHADGLVEVKACGTMTVDRLALSDWLAAVGITPVAMERTDESWKPVYHIWAEEVTVFVVHVSHVTQSPGRQMDQADARWVAKLMRDGLRQRASSRLPASVCSAI